jgi:hypothetical protein
MSTNKLIEELRAADISGHGEYSRMAREAADCIESLQRLLEELIDIEGPQPGTRMWADKVFAALEAMRKEATS